jgi:hypothetical protein
VSGKLIPGENPDEAEHRQYAALTETLAGMLDLWAGLADAINVADYAAAAPLHTSIYMAERKAERIVAQAWARAEEMRAQAEAQVQAILGKAQREATSERNRAEMPPEDILDQQSVAMERIYEILAAEPDKLFSARTVAPRAGVPLILAKSLLTHLTNTDRIAHNHRAHLYSARPDAYADPGP